jgi:hypothetical protein
MQHCTFVIKLPPLAEDAGLAFTDGGGIVINKFRDLESQKNHKISRFRVFKISRLNSLGRRQADRQTSIDREAGTEKGRQAESRYAICMHATQASRHADRQTGRQAGRSAGRQASKQIGRQTCRQQNTLGLVADGSPTAGSHHLTALTFDR